MNSQGTSRGVFQSLTYCLVTAFTYETLNVQEIEKKTIHTKIFRSYKGLNFIYDSFNVDFQHIHSVQLQDG